MRQISMKNKLKIIRKPIYTYLKKHKCLKCGNELEVGQTKKTVNQHTEDFSEYSHWYDGAYPIGDIEITEDIFICKECNFCINAYVYHRIEKKVSRMEKKTNKYDNNFNIDVFMDIW